MKIINMHKNKIPVTEEVYSAFMAPLWRDAKKLQRRNAFFEANNLSIISIEGTNPPIAVHDTPESIYLQTELHQEIMRAISTLSANDAELIDWIYFKEQTLSDYAEKTGIPYSTLAYRHKRALKKLKNVLKNSND